MHSKLLKMSDEELFALIKKGNHLAFRQMYDSYWLGLYKSAYNILQDQALTEDVLQEVFTDIWNRKETLEIRNLKSYLFTAVRNNTLLKLRSEKFTSLQQLVNEPLTLVPEVELNLDHLDLQKNIDTSIEALPKRCREIFYMSRYEHYSIAEIAAHFNISNRTVENQLHRALKHLRASLGILYFLLQL